MERPGQALHTAAELGVVGSEGDVESWGCRDRGGSSRSPSLSCETARSPGLPGQAVEGLWELELTRLLTAPRVGECVHAPQSLPSGGNHVGTVAKVHVTQVRVTEPRCARALLHHVD